MPPTPEWFFALMLTRVVPVVLACMVLGAALGLAVKTLKNAARRATAPHRRR